MMWRGRLAREIFGSLWVTWRQRSRLSGRAQLDSFWSAPEQRCSTGQVSAHERRRSRLHYCSLAYSAFASFSTGMSGSASFHSAKKS